MKNLGTDVDDLVKLAFFAGIATSITGTRSIRGALDAVMEHIGTIFAPRNWSLFLRNPRTGELAFTVVVGSAVEGLKGRILPAGTGIVGWIADHAQSVIIEDVAKDSRFDRGADLASGFRTKSIIGVPLVEDGKVIGVIELVNELDDRVFTALDLKILHTIADFAAIAIERAYYFRALRKISSIDHLTGIANRRAFERALAREKERAVRGDKGFAILLVDIDDFKGVNDRHGHETGDRVLKALAALLEASTRRMDTVARLGGDEFVVLLPEADRHRGEEVRSRILAAVARTGSDELPSIRVSIGLEVATKDTIEAAVAGADRDMYLRKQLRTDREIEKIATNIGDFLTEEDGEDSEFDPH